MKINDMYGDWTILEIGRYQNRPGARARCKCGKEQWHIQRNLIKGNSKKCKQCSYNDRGPLLAKRITGDHLAAKDKYTDYKVKAKQRDIDFELDFDTFKKIVKEDCYYCGQEPSNTNRLPNKEWADDFVYSGLDRLDNSIGYRSDNVVPCCKYCNYMKRELSYQEFFERVSKIAKKWSPGSVIIMAKAGEMTQEEFNATQDLFDGKTIGKFAVRS